MQVTSWPAAVHPESDDTNVSGAGSASVTCTALAVDGPAFDTTMRYVKIKPGDTDGLSAVFSADTSALPTPTTGVMDALLLLAGAGSGVGLATVATFGRSLPVPV